MIPGVLELQIHVAGGFVKWIGIICIFLVEFAFVCDLY